MKYSKYLLHLPITFILVLCFVSCNNEALLTKQETDPDILAVENFKIDFTHNNIEENLEKGSIIATISSPVTSLNFTEYKITESNVKNAFKLVNNNQIVVDDPSALNYEINPMISFMVEANNIKHEKTKEFSIELKDNPNEPFSFVIETTQENELISIPADNSLTNYNYDIDWGDGKEKQIKNTGDKVKRYPVPGTYVVKITGSFPRWAGESGNTNSKIRSIESWGDIQWESMAYMLENTQNLIINATDIPDLRKVNQAQLMFSNAQNISDTNNNLSKWDTSNFTDISEMFNNSNFNPNISNWDVSNVINMEKTFVGAKEFNRDISQWDVSSVKDMNSMFFGATIFNHDLSQWETQKVTDCEFFDLESGISTEHLPNQGCFASN